MATPSSEGVGGARGAMRVRGHHLCCSVCFLGSGKVEARDYFGIDNAIPELVRRILADPAAEIELTDTFDDVCGVCPLRSDAGCGRGQDPEGIRRQNEKLAGWDLRIFEALGVEPGTRTTFAGIYGILRERIPDIGVICTNCSSSKPSGFSAYRDGLRMLAERI